LNHIFSSNRKCRVFISVKSKKLGGGANTFAKNFSDWLRIHRDEFIHERNIHRASLAIVVAHKVDEKDLVRAKSNGCFIIHRLDEHVEKNEDNNRREKHELIRRINQLADVTVYQSDFVFQNMHPYLSFPKKTKIILNGGDQTKFFPAAKAGSYIGHITWGVGEKKRLDLLYSFIRQHVDQRFLLVGNQEKSEYDFGKLPNVRCVGAVRGGRLLKYLHRMRWIYFPSENDPCPNTVVEGLLAGLPVCYNKKGGARELVQECGLPLERVDEMDRNLEEMRSKATSRSDLFFEDAAQKYIALYRQHAHTRC
jgi:glycosyltransferase involved in cell wall biosynthesis